MLIDIPRFENHKTPDFDANLGRPQKIGRLSGRRVRSDEADLRETVGGCYPGDVVRSWAIGHRRGGRRLGIIGRLGEWSEIGKVRPIEELPGVAAGRDGEVVLRDWIGESYRLGEASVLAGRRIPSRRQGRRREIDLIVCTPAVIHLIEAKNWSGQLEVRGRQWLQTRRNGERVDHGDLLAEQGLKRDAVVEYLNDRGLGLDDRFVRDRIAPKVIFTNPRLDLDPEVEALPEVISRRELDNYLGRVPVRGLGERMAASVLAFCLDWEARRAGGPAAIPPDRNARIVEALAEVGTWDRLEFHGTRVVAGDVLSLRASGRTYGRAELQAASNRVPMHLRWTRGRALGLFKAVTGLGTLGSLELGNARIPIAPGDTVTFHAVGEREPAERRLVELDRIVMG